MSGRRGSVRTPGVHRRVQLRVALSAGERCPCRGAVRAGRKFPPTGDEIRPGRAGSSRCRPRGANGPENAASGGVELDPADGAQSDAGLTGQS